MKKSCSGNELKKFTVKDVEANINDIEDSSKIYLTEKANYINKKLLESEVQKESIVELEKKNRLKAIIIPLKSAGSEKYENKSLRLTEADASTPAECLASEKREEIVFSPRNTEVNTTKCQEINEENLIKLAGETDCQKEKLISCDTKLSNRTNINTGAPKLIKTLHYTTAEVEESAKEENFFQTKINCEEQNQTFSIGKKRTPFSVNTIVSVKKIKMETTTSTTTTTITTSVSATAGATGTATSLTNCSTDISYSSENLNNHSNNILGSNTNDNNNHNISSSSNSNNNNNCNSNGNGTGTGITNIIELNKKRNNVLEIELQMEKKRHSIPFKRRDIKTIMFECDLKNTKWKETFLKYKGSSHWGIPIIKNSTEKWDGKHIPLKLLRRYQKYLSSNNLIHPIFSPRPTNICSDVNTISDISSKSSIGSNTEYKNESEKEFKELKQDEGLIFQDKESQLNSKDPTNENHLNASTHISENTERMVLRNRNQYKPVILDNDEDYSSEDSDEWHTKQKPVKKQKTHLRNKRGSVQNNHLLLKLERCNITKKNEVDKSTENKNGENFSVGSFLVNNSKTQTDVTSKYAPEPESMACPICSHRFKKQFIEDHATECASKTFKD